MALFLLSGDKAYTYDDLLHRLCEDNYIPLLKTHDIFRFLPIW